MGCPVYVTVADLVIKDVDEGGSVSLEKKSTLWERYVDDTITAIINNMIEELHKRLNSKEPLIKLTVEIQADGQIPSLNVPVLFNDDGSLDITFYRKPTHTGIYTNSNSDSLEHVWKL